MSNCRVLGIENELQSWKGPFYFGVRTHFLTLFFCWIPVQKRSHNTLLGAPWMSIFIFPASLGYENYSPTSQFSSLEPTLTYKTSKQKCWNQIPHLLPLSPGTRWGISFGFVSSLMLCALHTPCKHIHTHTTYVHQVHLNCVQCCSQSIGLHYLV